MIKNIILTLFAALSMSMFAQSSAYAFEAFTGVNCNDRTYANSTVCRDKAKGATNPISGPNGVIIKIADIISYIAGIAAIIFLIIAGINYSTSSGDSSKINNARRTVIYTLVGVFVVAIARTLVEFGIRIFAP